MAVNLGSAYGKVELDISGLVNGVSNGVKSIEQLKSKVSTVGQSMQQLGGIMTAAFTVPLALVGKSALSTFEEYEKAMNILGAVSGATSEEMKKLSQLAKDLGADLTLPGTSAADAAQAMAELAKAGMSINDIMSATKGVLQMSAAGQLSNAEAAEITANAMNAFKLSGEDAIRIADLLAAGANSSSAEVREMADSLKMSSSVFASAGMEIQELVTSISLMANAGIQGSDAGTSLKQMLLSLQAPSKDAKAIMKQLGISVYDSSGNMLSMREIIQNFSDSMEGLTQKQRNAALATIFGSDAVRAANIVLLGGVDAYDQMLGKVTQVGSAADLASAMMQGLTGATENVKSAFETASIAAIEPFKDDLKSLLDVVAKALNAFAALPEPVRKFIVTGLFLLAVTGPILVMFGTLLSTVASIINAFGVLGISLGSITAAAGAAGTAIAGVGASILTILGPILLIVGALALLYWAFSTNFMGIRTAAQQLWFILKYYFMQGWQALLMVSQQRAVQLANFFRSMATRLRDIFRTINWQEVGKFILMGLANGMLLGIPLIVAAAIKAANAALAALKKGLDSHSPSRKTTIEGLNAAKGFTNGMDEGMDPRHLTRIFSRPVQAAAQSTNQSVQMNFANGVTIRQVQQMLQLNNDQLIRKLNASLGGA